MKPTENVKILRKTDVALIAALFIFAVMFYFIFNLNPKTGDAIIIKLNNAIYDEVYLSQNKDVSVYLDDGTLLNTVRILDGKAFIVYANCPDKLCVKHKSIDSHSNIADMIVCLPNRVTVEIKQTKDKQDKKYDIIIKK